MSFHFYSISLFYFLFVYTLIDKSELKEFVEDERLYKSTKRDLIFVLDMIENIDKTKIVIDTYFNSESGFFSWLKNELISFLYNKVCDGSKYLIEMAKDKIRNKKMQICKWSGGGFLFFKAASFIGITNLLTFGVLACVTNTIYEQTFN